MKKPLRSLTVLVFLLFASLALYAQVPAITSLSPESGLLNDVITVNGSGFNSTAANNIVYFGSVRATVVTAAAGVLTVKVPVGASFAPVSVTTGNKTAYSAASFLPLFNCGATFSSTSYQTPIVIATGATPQGSTMADLDNDGKLDLIVASSGSNLLSILRNTATPGVIDASSFSKTDIPIQRNAFQLTTGDLNGDGLLDIIVGTFTNGSDTVAVLQNISTPGNIQFKAPVYLKTGTAQMCTLNIADMDKDGKPEIAVVLRNNGAVVIFKNNNNGGDIATGDFTRSTVPLSSTTTANDMVVKDMNMDGLPDIVVPEITNAKVHVLINNNNLSFTDNVIAVGYSFIWGISVADMDGDGKPDIVGNYRNNAKNFTIPNTTSGTTFSTGPYVESALPAGVTGIFLSTADLNSDGKPDIVVGSLTSTTISVQLNTSTPGHISYAPTIGVGSAGVALQTFIGDIDGDGMPDMASCNNSNGVRVMRSQAGLVIGEISGNTPICGIGSTITLTNTISGGTWTSSNPAVATVGASTGLVTSLTAGNTVITYTITNNVCTLTKTVTVTVGDTPTITLGTVAGVGIAATAFTLPYTAATGSPDKYSITTGATAMTGFVPVANAALGTSPISVNIPASAAGTYDFNLTVTNSTTGCVSAILPFTLTVSSGPAIGATGTLAAVNTTYGTASATPTSFAVSASNLTANISVTVPTGFEIAITAGGTYTSTLSLTPTSGTYSGNVYVRLAANAAAGAYSGNVTLSSTGATDATIATASSTVAQATLTYTATQASKTYGNANPSFTGTVSGFVNGETQATAATGTLVWSSPATAVSIPGSYAINGSGLTAANYTFVQDAGNSTKFLINDFTTPTNPATNIVFSNISTAGFTASWTNGSGTSRAVFIAAASSGSPAPANNTTYTANTAFGSAASQIGASGWYCVYNGTGTTVNITGLNAVTSYTVKVVEYNGTSGYEKYSPPGGLNNPNTQITNSPTTTITSITRNLAALTNSASVPYTVTFGTSVTGLSASNFSITPTGTVAGASVGLISGSGTTYTVNVNTGTGDGNLTLNLANATGLTPGISTALPFTGQAYTVDKTAPGLDRGTFTSNNTNPALAKVGDVVTLNFYANEKIQAPTVTIAGHSVTATNPSTDGINWIATYAMAQGDTEGLVNFSVSATDLVGNSMSAPETATSTRQTLAFDKTAPAAPANLAATAGNTQNVLIWKLNTEPDINKYTLYGGITANPTTRIIDLGAGISTYTHVGLTNGITYYYRLQATDNAGNTGTITADVSATPKASQTITFAATASKLYGDADYTPDASSTNNGITITYSSDNAQVATIVNGKAHIVGAGIAHITASQPGSAAFTAATDVAQTLTISPAALTIAADNKTRVYGTANQALTAIYSGFVNGDTNASLTAQPSLGTTATAASGVGTYVITPSGAASANYSISYTTGIMTITKANLVIAADNKTKIYGNPNPVFTATYTGFVNGDSNAGLTTQPSLNTPATVASAAGTYAITASGAASTNYNINYAAGTLTVTNATLTIAATNASKTYGAANPTLAFTYSGFVNGDTPANLSTPPSVSTAATAASGAGVYPITVSGAISANYTLVYVPAALTVNKAVLNVSADNKSRNYGLANPALTLTYSGFVNGDSQASLTTLATAVTNATSTSLPGNYAIIASGAVSPNYNFTYSSGTFTVIPLTIATLNNLNISQGQLSPAFSGSTYTYNTSVIFAINSITLMPTADATATITVNGTATGNGSASAPIALKSGDNTITTVVTAQDGITKLTYIVIVHRPLAPADIIPTNVLSPNGDGKNDAWIIKDIQLYPDNKVTIYDRAGREVYSKKGYSNDWNGTLKGAPLTQGTYYYLVDLGPGYETLKGFITILKVQ